MQQGKKKSKSEAVPDSCRAFNLKGSGPILALKLRPLSSPSTGTVHLHTHREVGTFHRSQSSKTHLTGWRKRHHPLFGQQKHKTMTFFIPFLPQTAILVLLVCLSGSCECLTPLKRRRPRHLSGTESEICARMRNISRNPPVCTGVCADWIPS